MLRSARPIASLSLNFGGGGGEESGVKGRYSSPHARTRARPMTYLSAAQPTTLRAPTIPPLPPERCQMKNKEQRLAIQS